MGKLSNLGGRLGLLPSLVKPAADRHGHDRGEEPWRKWYRTADWRALKQAAHIRDNYICQRSGVICCGAGNDWNAPVANHKIPHRGRKELFFDLANIETVSKQVHDSRIQSEERRARAHGFL